MLAVPRTPAPCASTHPFIHPFIRPSVDVSAGGSDDDDEDAAPPPPPPPPQSVDLDDSEARAGFGDADCRCGVDIVWSGEGLVWCGGALDCCMMSASARLRHQCDVFPCVCMLVSHYIYLFSLSLSRTRSLCRPLQVPPPPPSPAADKDVKLALPLFSGGRISRHRYEKSGVRLSEAEYAAREHVFRRGVYVRVCVCVCVCLFIRHYDFDSLSLCCLCLPLHNDACSIG